MHHRFGILSRFFDCYFNCKFQMPGDSIAEWFRNSALKKERQWKPTGKTSIGNKNMTQNTVRAVSTWVHPEVRESQRSRRRTSPPHHTSHRLPRDTVSITHLHTASCDAPRWPRGARDSWKTPGNSPKLVSTEGAPRFNSWTAVSVNVKVWFNGFHKWTEFFLQPNVFVAI